jgi:hypothetical protein
MEFICSLSRFLHKFSYKMEKLIGIIIIKGAQLRFLHSTRLQTPRSRTPRPHAPLPHAPLPHAPLPHAPLPHAPLPHAPRPPSCGLNLLSGECKGADAYHSQGFSALAQTILHSH